MRRFSLEKKYSWWGWAFVFPASILIFILSFYPMVQALFLSFRSGLGNNLKFSGFRNYARLFEDLTFHSSVANVFIYLLFQVPIMLFSALILASILNQPDLKGKTVFRTLIFLPCATALVSSALIFKSFFSMDGIINFTLQNLHIISEPKNWLLDPIWSKVIIIIIITWRWTGYNTIFYMAGLQNIDTSVYEAARIDGASASQQFFKITLPLLRPVILLTTIMSTNGTLQLFDEVRTISPGTGFKSTITISQHIYNVSFTNVPQLGYAAALSYTILIMVAFLSFIQMKVGDKV
ncbi:ABC transporter, permease protein [Leadbettera azotonutricia ZAS-9]|uniref:ABC transporter, permease protein n=2 Tax=Leadbettera azotonutricia TaxID=150829 RepID=F5YGG9_LEAAZ|nr:ABC transporter, permease protein [Leadbettera azotonutricia ZAS-9]